MYYITVADLVPKRLAPEIKIKMITINFILGLSIVEVIKFSKNQLYFIKYSTKLFNEQVICHSGVKALSFVNQMID